MAPQISEDEPPLRIVYRFEFDDIPGKEFVVELDPSTLELRNRMSPARAPDWTHLEVAQCENCPLSIANCKICPAALSLVEIIEFFAEANGHDEATTIVETKERTYLKHCSLQIGISSLMGLILPASGCPIAEPLRPLVRSHLPFSTSYETVPRVAAWYLLEQYLGKREGQHADWALSQLVEFYHEIEKMNRGLSKRLSARKVEDASRNAVVHLAIFGELLTFSISEDSLREVLDSLFD